MSWFDADCSTNKGLPINVSPSQLRAQNLNIKLLAYWFCFTTIKANRPLFFYSTWFSRLTGLMKFDCVLSTGNVTQVLLHYIIVLYSVFLLLEPLIIGKTRHLLLCKHDWQWCPFLADADLKLRSQSSLQTVHCKDNAFLTNSME
jgi:hypothetical protein